jgi:hypothetical protein
MSRYDTEKCLAGCGAYVPEGRQICPACEREANTGINGKTAESILRRYRPAIIRAAKAHPAKTIDRNAVYELGEIGLPYLLAAMAEWKEPTNILGARQQLIEAIAKTRVLVERLAIVHCSTEQDADAYRFYLEQAARSADPQR